MCLTVSRSCHLSLWEVCSQVLIALLVNATNTSIVESDSILYNDQESKVVPPYSIYLEIEFKRFLRSQTIFEVIKGLFDSLSAS